MPNLSIGLRIAFRSRFSWLAGSSLFLMTLAAYLSAQFSGRHPGTVAMDVGLSVIRLILPLVVVLITQEVLSREFDRRYYLNSLSCPHPRYNLLLGRFLSIVLLTFGLLIVLAASLALLVWAVTLDYTQSTPTNLGALFLITVTFIGIDLLVLTTVATLLAVVASTSSFVLVGTLGFMLVARSFGAIIELLTNNTGLVDDAESYRSRVGLLGYLVPDLGALDIRMITLYGRIEFLPPDWPWLILSNLVYAVGLLSLAIWALQHKRFA